MAAIKRARQPSRPSESHDAALRPPNSSLRPAPAGTGDWDVQRYPTQTPAAPSATAATADPNRPGKKSQTETDQRQASQAETNQRYTSQSETDRRQTSQSETELTDRNRPETDIADRHQRQEETGRRERERERERERDRDRLFTKINIGQINHKNGYATRHLTQIALKMTIDRERMKMTKAPSAAALSHRR